ncbi:MAG: hypothetical protein KGL43_16795 [Burkholderiales bacterium]|nr:hypothetical protein [Burkholderiales bacterium]MDE2394945.1 hypothetical protein [Burkholderiales bacterium]MDE2455248.1 hypothetical protein [Burkholderiales bacterium]
MFRYRHQLRRWAAGLLFLWLFGVGTGVANACLASGSVMAVPSRVDHAFGMPAQHRPAATVTGNDHCGPGAAASDDSASISHDSAHRSNCHEFCDQASVSLPTLKSTIDKIQGTAAIPIRIAVLLPAPAFAPVRLWVPSRDGVAAPPIPIAFLRLTL